jgi:hypothetical protein
MNRIGRRNVVSRCEGFVVPAIAKSDGKQRITATDYILTGRYCRTLRRCVGAIDNPDVTRRGTGATDQQGTQDKASHQALKARDTHTLRNDCETHPPLPLWWLKNWKLPVQATVLQIQLAATPPLLMKREALPHTFAGRRCNPFNQSTVN